MTFAKALATDLDEFVLLHANAAVELRPDRICKDIAVAGRMPVYFGDDTTDEPALAWVIDHGGVAVKVGPGDSVARHLLSSPAEMQAALADWLESGWRDQ